MDWLTIRCAHCRSTYKRQAKAVAPCPHCFRLQPADAVRARVRRLGCLWLFGLPPVCAVAGAVLGALGLESRAGAVGLAIVAVAAVASVGLEAVNTRARHKLRAIHLMEAGQLLDPEENPESLDQQVGRAVAAGDQATAAQLLYRVAALTPQRLEVWTELAHSLIAQKRYEEAFGALERAHILDPESHVVWQAKAVCSLAAGRAEEALRHLDMVLEKRPDDATLWAHRALALQQLRRLPDALQSAGEAVDKGPGNPVNWLTLARVQEEAGDQGARASYLDFLARTDALAARQGGPLHLGGVDLAATAAEVRARLGPARGQPAFPPKLYLSATAASLAERLLQGTPPDAYEEKAPGWTAADGCVVAYTQLPAGVSGRPVAPVEVLELSRGRGLALDPGQPGERRFTSEELGEMREDVLLSR